ncbi:hypothetical protein ZWY2020_055778 [Hordeum vulgare]|nr:hypothetical protein ZWY2020_055778 [Hordeum vulgare]
MSARILNAELEQAPICFTYTQSQAVDRNFLTFAAAAILLVPMSVSGRATANRLQPYRSGVRVPIPPKHKSGSEKRKQKKKENELIESEKGALKRYFPVVTNVHNQRQESEPGKDDDLNSNDDSLDDDIDIDVNENEDNTGEENLQPSPNARNGE